MPKLITQYRVFLGSPGGLSNERLRFRKSLERYTKIHSEPRGVIFHPVGWEETISSVGRPQELINASLRQCDYAVFVLHERWGSATGNKFSLGTEEEWFLAEELYKTNKLRSIALFFREVDGSRINDPGSQLRAVLDFRQKIEAEKRYLFRQYDDIDVFGDALEEHLASWLIIHENGLHSLRTPEAVATTASTTRIFSTNPPNFHYWIGEATRLLNVTVPDYANVLFCARKSIDISVSNAEWAQAKNVIGIAEGNLGNTSQAIPTFVEISKSS